MKKIPLLIAFCFVAGLISITSCEKETWLPNNQRVKQDEKLPDFNFEEIESTDGPSEESYDSAG